MARKGRRRRFQEARELKHSFDDGLFAEGDRTLADVEGDDSDEGVDRDDEAGPEAYKSDG